MKKTIKSNAIQRIAGIIAIGAVILLSGLAFTGCVIEDPETLLQIDNISNSAITKVEIRVNNMSGTLLTNPPLSDPNLIPAKTSRSFPQGVGTYWLKVTGGYERDIIFTTTEGNTTTVIWDGSNLYLKGAAQQLKVTITGLGAYNGKLAYLDLSTSSASNTSVAWDSGTISNGSITFEMLDYDTDEPFKTTGTYYVVLMIGNNEDDIGDLYSGTITSRAFTATTNLTLTNFISSAPAKGTLVVKNTADATVNAIDWVIEILVKNSKGAATVVDSWTGELKTGQSKSFQLDAGSYYVRVNSEQTFEDEGYWDIDSVTVTAGGTTTLVWDGTGDKLRLEGASAPTKAATPTSNKAAGALLTTDTITLTCTTPGATIRYTTNGTSPTATTGTVYTTPFSLNAGSVTVKAKVFAFGNYLDSDELTVTYTVSAPQGTLVVKNIADATVNAIDWVIEIIVKDSKGAATVVDSWTGELKTGGERSFTLDPKTYYVRVNSEQTFDEESYWESASVVIQAAKTTTVTWDGTGNTLTVGTPQ